jgi:hypothetical protein
VLQVDVATRNYVVEAKCREDLSDRLWQWLGKLTYASERLRVDLADEQPKVPLLVLKRNGRRPLVVLALDDFEDLLTKGNE